MTEKFYVAIREDAPFVEGERPPTEAEKQRDEIAETLGAMFVEVQIGKLIGTAKVTASFGTDQAQAEFFTQVGDEPMAEKMVRSMLEMAGDAMPGSYGVAAVFEITDPLVAESLSWDVAFKMGLAERFTVYHWKEEEIAKPSGDYKTIEIYYDIDKIPEAFPDALDFRNAAMELVENALADAEAGEWEGAEIGMGEVNFGFEVEDFDLAENIVRNAVKGTPFEGIREITRYSDAS